MSMYFRQIIVPSLLKRGGGGGEALQKKRT